MCILYLLAIKITIQIVMLAFKIKKIVCMASMAMQQCRCTRFRTHFHCECIFKKCILPFCFPYLYIYENHILMVIQNRKFNTYFDREDTHTPHHTKVTSNEKKKKRIFIPLSLHSKNESKKRNNNKMTMKNISRVVWCEIGIAKVRIPLKTVFSH